MNRCYHVYTLKRKHIVTVAFRLDESKHRQLRIALASQGLSLQKALEQRVDEIIAQGQYRSDLAQRPADLMGILADTGVMELREQERRAELNHDREQA